jgi:4-diphosphocytidyl-2-C-methyl-D-erythritol kinase
MTLTLHAHAKINLDLRVLATRADGYHELATVFQTLALHDVLTIRPAGEGIALTCSDPGVPVDRRNLVWRAVEALRREHDPKARSGGVAIDLLKRIPAAAGLGGGSADAAAALVGVAALWGVPMSRETLARLARELGADVPFFLWGGTALGVGRGDELVPLPALPPMTVLVAKPAFGVSTADAFRWFDESSSRGSAPGSWPADAGAWRTMLPACRNDLEPAVVARHPALGRLVRALRNGGALLAAMSGSGSAVFGLFVDRSAARAVGKALQKGSVEVWLTETLDADAHEASRGPLRSAAGSARE